MENQSKKDLYDENVKIIWEVARTLWIKYCGVADEYKMLRDRWLYIHDPTSLSTLPYYLKTTTFTSLDAHVQKLDRTFKQKFGFERDKLENYTESFQYLREVSLEEYSKIRDNFFILCSYVGLLKLAFFQRTVSSELAHVASGVPHSPERTVGNELFYLAADKVSKRYQDCIYTRYANWDGFTTFAPIITDEFFYGGFMRPSSSLKLFHVSLSEEQKYFVGSYLGLAHEFGHAAWDSNDNPEEPKKSYLNYIRSVAIKNSIGSWQKSFEECKECMYNPNKLIWYSLERHPFNEFFSDIFGIKIGGINVIHSILDECFFLLDSPEVVTDEDKRQITIRVNYPPSPEIILRINGVCCYLKNFNRSETYGISKRLEDLFERSKEHLKTYYAELKEVISGSDIEILGGFSGIIKRDKCVRCLKGISEAWSDSLFHFDPEWSKHYIKDEFETDEKEKEEIVNSLCEGIPQINKDPRHILNAYYEAYRESTGEERPSYAATIHSLAFNEYKSKKGLKYKWY